jgi:uncharacterized protein YndB with AHSA1/START domain
MTTTAQPDCTYTLTLRATPDRVWRALTDAGELRAWFAEHAEVDLRPGGAWRFWGRHSLGVPTPDAADQRIEALEPERRLAFTWTWSGVPTRVELLLEPREWREFALGSEPPSRPPEPGCALTVKQSFAGTLPYPRPAHLAEDHWRLAIANLFAHLDGSAVSLPDCDDPAPEVRVSLFVAARPATVFRTLTEPALLDRWLASSARVDLRVGGAIDLGWSGGGDGETPGEGALEILELVPDRRLVLAWPDWRGSADVPMQRVSWELTASGAGTRVELRHTGFVRAVDRSDYFQGWAGFLGGMARVAASAR